MNSTTNSTVNDIWSDMILKVVWIRIYSVGKVNLKIYITIKIPQG
jgi:hypothetical protein